MGSGAPGAWNVCVGAAVPQVPLLTQDEGRGRQRAARVMCVLSTVAQSGNGPRHVFSQRVASPQTDPEFGGSAAHLSSRKVVLPILS